MNKESIQRKSSPAAGVISEFYCFLPCPVLIRHPGSAKPGLPSMARPVLFFKKQ